MRKLRVYIDTSVIGGCYDVEFSEWSNKLFDEFIYQRMIAVISDVTLAELKNAPLRIKNRLDDIPKSSLELIEKTDEIIYLSSKYIEFNAISKNCLEDSLHIAASIVNNVELLASWNFKHIVNYRRIKLFNSINLMFGYPEIDIRTPREIINE